MGVFAAAGDVGAPGQLLIKSAVTWKLTNLLCERTGQSRMKEAAAKLLALPRLLYKI